MQSSSDTRHPSVAAGGESIENHHCSSTRRGSNETEKSRWNERDNVNQSDDIYQPNDDDNSSRLVASRGDEQPSHHSAAGHVISSYQASFNRRDATASSCLEENGGGEGVDDNNSEVVSPTSSSQNNTSNAAHDASVAADSSHMDEEEIDRPLDWLDNLPARTKRKLTQLSIIGPLKDNNPWKRALLRARARVSSSEGGDAYRTGEGETSLAPSANNTDDDDTDDDTDANDTSDADDDDTDDDSMAFWDPSYHGASLYPLWQMELDTSQSF